MHFCNPYLDLIEIRLLHAQRTVSADSAISTGPVRVTAHECEGHTLGIE